MRKVLTPLIVALLLLSLFVTPTFGRRRAFAHVQTATSSSGDDQTLTFASPIGASNHVYIFASLTNEAQTISITSTTLTFATKMGPTDSAGFNIRMYVFCAQGDGVDDTFGITTSGAAAAIAHGVEFSGGSCNLDGTAQTNDDSGDTDYELTTDVTVSNLDSLLFGHIRSDSGANFDPIFPNTQIGTDNQASSVEYNILTNSGAFDTLWGSGANENALLQGLAFAAGAGGVAPCKGSFFFRRVGC